MPKTVGRPKKALKDRRTDRLEIRLDFAERVAFKEAADIAGVALSSWIRERARRAAVRELEEAGRQVAFLRYLTEEHPE